MHADATSETERWRSRPVILQFGFHPFDHPGQNPVTSRPLRKQLEQLGELSRVKRLLPKSKSVEFGVAALLRSAEFLGKMNTPRFAEARLQPEKSFGQRPLKKPLKKSSSDEF
jgi:hypothetical protein